MYRILIADDEVIERAVLYQTLEEKLVDRCEIFQAKNGREALEIHEREKIQIAILDIEMPGINGIEAAEEIRKRDKECCIIFLTAFDEFSYAKKAITVKALDYLLKPCVEQELLLVLEEAMAQIDEHNLQKGAVEVLPEMEELSDVRMSRVAELLQEYIREHYMYDISMHDVARTMNYSEAYFCKLFKQCFGRNFTSYLTEYRVNEAKKLLEQPNVNVKNVGKAVGYMDSGYFTKVFRRITGKTPTEYRMEIFQK